jgi:hypothetical protein
VRTRSIAIVCWLLIGHAVLGGLYWLLLQVPESNALMLAASALLVLALVYGFGVVQIMPLRAAGASEPMGRALAVAAGRAWLVVVPLAVFALIWFVTGLAEGWAAGHAGEIDAWFIARLGWTKIGWLHTGIHIVLTFVQFGIGVSLAVSMLAAIAASGVKGLVSGGWLGGGLRWRYVLAVVAALIVGFALPSHALYWRPASLPVTWAQPAFAAVKLFLLFVVANAAWAFILLKASRPPAAT